MPPSTSRHHTEWLSLIEVSGPFLSLPVLLRVFPQGLDAHDPELFRGLRAAYEDWEDNQSGRRVDPSLHRQWLRLVLEQVLELPGEVLAEGQAIPQTLKATVAEHGETLRPDVVVVNPQGGADPGKPRLLIQTYPLGQGLDSPVAGKHWKASPSTRMMELLHATDIRLGLITNGERWMLVDAPRGETTGFASWYANLWLDEQVTLRAFRSLLGVHRFFAVAPTDTLEAMLAESAENQQEVTDQLGYQVRRAVEVLVQHLDRADQDHGRELLADVPETVRYEAALTVMMRLVFLFCAEERDLLLLGDPLYDQHYAVSTLREQLREAADLHGEEVLERRLDAWCRLLATFRGVFAGVQHDRMRLLAYGGRLFDPDRFPFLEGRQPGTSWRTHAASPMPVNNRTVLHLLESLQLLEVKLPGGGPPETQRLSFRALDIEQIGHVYEGLLDHTAKRADEPILGLSGTRDKEPEIALSELEAQLLRGEDECVKYLREQTGRSENALRKALRAACQPEEPYLGVTVPAVTHHSPLATHSGRLLAVCGNDPDLCQRVQPVAGLIRTDTFGYPIVIPAGSVYVTAGTDRRSSGTHYTPRSLTEPIVQYTLEPLVYVGPAEGKPKEEWQLRPAAELLDLRICDMACGSGAFLVQACRYMSERLAEAWEDAERRVVSGECGVVSNDKATTSGGEDDGSSELSGSGGLAEGDGPRGVVLQSNEGLPEGRTLRLDQPDPDSSFVGSSQHSRGTGPPVHQGVPQPPEHSPRLPDGTGDPSATQPSSGPAGRVDTPGSPDTVGRDQQDALRTSELTSEAPVGSGELRTDDGEKDLGPDAASAVPPSLTTPHSPLSTHPPLITPFGFPSTGAPGETLIPTDPDERLAFARRLVARRCLYGVDINPLAVEMAKLSLWLLTLAKDKPFTFLDHAIRCGDSLVGIRDLRQLEVFNLDGQGESNPLFLQFQRGRIERAVELRRRIEERPADRPEDVEAQAELMRQAEEQIGRLKWAADMLVAADFQGTTAKEREAALLDNSMVVAQHFDETDTGFLRRQAEKALSGEWRVDSGEKGQTADAVGRGRSLTTPHSPLITPFHWPLEFPEVVVGRGGFDAFVCNPPFMGGAKLETAFGAAWRRHIVELIGRGLTGVRGGADLCTYFLLRMQQLVGVSGFTGMLATNSIGQGDSRAVGLEGLADLGRMLFRALSSAKWPGVATVHFSALWVSATGWRGRCMLDEQPVTGISSLLTEGHPTADPPMPLDETAIKAFKGSMPLGAGFVLEP